MYEGPAMGWMRESVRAYTVVDEGAGEADPVGWTMMVVKEIWSGGQASH